MVMAAVIGGAALVGGATTLISGNKAAKAQEDAANMSVAEQQREYDQTRADYAPWRTTGQAALGKLGSLYGINADGTAGTPAATQAQYDEFRATPGYQFQMDEGTKAVQRSAAARGLLNSGGTLKAIDRYSSGLADSTYGQYVNQLQSLAGVGQSATGSTAAAGQNAANNISSAYTNAGNARASSYANTGSAINGALNNLASVYAYSAGGGFNGNQLPGGTTSDPYIPGTHLPGTY